MVGECVDLLRNYPKPKRDLSARIEGKTEEVRTVAKKFGEEFFDGDRIYGYGGYYYNSRFWSSVVPDFENFTT